MSDTAGALGIEAVRAALLRLGLSPGAELGRGRMLFAEPDSDGMIVDAVSVELGSPDEILVEYSRFFEPIPLALAEVHVRKHPPLRAVLEGAHTRRVAVRHTRRQRPSTLAEEIRLWSVRLDPEPERLAEIIAETVLAWRNRPLPRSRSAG